MSLKQDTTEKLKSLKGYEIKKVNYYKYLGIYVSSTVEDINIRLGKIWTALNAINKIWS